MMINLQQKLPLKTNEIKHTNILGRYSDKTQIFSLDCNSDRQYFDRKIIILQFRQFFSVLGSQFCKMDRNSVLTETFTTRNWCKKTIFIL